MNPYMELPKLNRPANGVARSSAYADQAISAAAYRAVNAAEALGNAVRRLLQTWRQWRAIRASVATLSALDDRTLRDIGIDRSEIRSVVEEIQRADTAGTASPSPRVDRIVGARAGRPDSANDNGRIAESACCA